MRTAKARLDTRRSRECARRVASLALAVALAVAAQAEPAQTFDFEVYLDEKPIGSARFHVSDDGARREVRGDTALDVRLWFIPAYSYRQRDEQTWRDGCLERIEAKTDDDGEPRTVSGRRVGSAFALAIDGRSAPRLPGCIMTFAYWDPAFLSQSQLLNSQTGELEPVSVTPLGRAPRSARGREVAATGHRIRTGATAIDVWYDADGRWIGLESDTRGGRLRYVSR